VIPRIICTYSLHIEMMPDCRMSIEARFPGLEGNGMLYTYSCPRNLNYPDLLSPAPG
jgi:hypothetical protein